MSKKTGKKDFMPGLDRLILNSTSEAPTQPAPEEREQVQPQTSHEGMDEAPPQPSPKGREPKTKVEKEKQITITIPPNLKKTIKKYCANNDITIKELFIRSVSRYMKGGSENV